MKVLLVSNRLFHYRINVYNYFREEFLKKNIQFEVLADEIQKCEEQVEFPVYILSRNYPAYRKKINEIGPDVIIFFLHLKNTSIFPLYWYSKIKNIKTIYWGHGINLDKPNSFIRRKLFAYLHMLSDAIILYSPDQSKYIHHRHHPKTFIALNTINFNSLPTIQTSKEQLRKKYGLNYKTIVLFCARVTPNKQLDILIDIFSRSSDPSIGLLIVGGGLSPALKAIVDKQANIKYYGAVYEATRVNELHKLSDLYCIPGKCGLGINIAMYWSLPILTTNVIQAPEIYYLKNGRNGFIASNQTDLREKIQLLTEDHQLRHTFAEQARRIITKEADITNMFKGFSEAVLYATRK